MLGVQCSKGRVEAKELLGIVFTGSHHLERFTACSFRVAVEAFVGSA